jgi:protein-tyrosine kinase
VNVSVIENALEKMRRSTGSPEPAVVPAAARANTLPARPQVAEPPPPPESGRVLAIDRAQLRAQHYFPEQAEERRFANYYRDIKRPIIHKALQAGASPDLRLILVSSALPGEGKTFTTLNLALSMAREQDISVLLIDADLPRAHLSRMLGVAQEPGLLNALHDESIDVESLVLRTDTRGLSVLPSGGTTDSASELLGSERMVEIAARLVARNPRRLALFDCSPILASSEVRALVRIPGQIILVARAGETPRQALINAIAHVDGRKLSGVVLNDAFIGRGEGYYDYASYYQRETSTRTAD